MELKCEFCTHIFTKKQALIYHQKTAKYCLKLRGTQSTYKCEICGKELSDKRYFEKHQEKCNLSIEIKMKEVVELKYSFEQYKQQVDFLKKIIEDKDKLIQSCNEQIHQLQNKLENIAIQGVKKHSSVTNNNIINNLIPITDEHLKEQAQFLTLEHIKQGALGYANFACDYALKDRITCVDVSRRKVKYKNPDGLVITDPEMSVLSKKLFSSIQQKNTEVTRQYKKELRELILQKFAESGDDMTDEQTRDLDRVIEDINKHMENVSNLHSDVTKIAEGEKPNIYHEFIKEVCNKTVV